MTAAGPNEVEWPYSIPAIIDLRDRLAATVLCLFSNQVVTEENFDLLLDTLCETLPKSLKRSIVSESIWNLSGQTLTAELVTETCHRLAGNMPRLRRERPVPPWASQHAPEWVPMQIMVVDRAMGFKNECGALLSFKVMAGTPCPRLLQRWWSLRWCRYMSRAFGFHRSAAALEKSGTGHRYLEPEQFTTFRLDGLIDPELSERGPAFKRVFITPSGLKWNQEQLRYRSRRDANHRCPLQYPPQFPCQRCHAGYESCRAGTHRRDYVCAFCEECGLDEALFDPANLPSDICELCRRKKAYQIKGG